MTPLAPTVNLVAANSGGCIIVTADSPTPQVSAGAAAIAEYFLKAAGVVITITNYSAYAPTAWPVPIYVGCRPAVLDTAIESDIAQIVHDGFVIGAAATYVVVTGETETGTRFACNRFVEQATGTRWLMAGDNGEHVPALVDIDAVLGSELDNPRTTSRAIYPLPRNPHVPWNGSSDVHSKALEWAGRHRVHLWLNQEHNIGNLLSPAKYGVSNPEFFPMRNGVRYIPPTGDYPGWQPRFSAPGIASALATEIIAYIDANPAERSVSLSVNDSSGYSHDELPTLGFNSKGMRNVSDLYYGMLTSAIAEVNSRRPDLADMTYVAIAYRETFDPPSFNVSPQLVVYVCSDRYCWIDPAERAAAILHLQQWKARAPRLSVYDYVYGARYVAPRIYQASLRDTFDQLHQIGIEGAFAEWNTIWAEGPKAQTLLKQMWNPASNPPSDDDEWYAAAAGPIAAPRLKQYFDHWENVWTTLVPTTDWFKGSAPLTYAKFDYPGYLEAITVAHVATARSHLATALAQVTTDPQNERLKEIRNNLDYTDASVYSYPRHVSRPTTAAQAISLIDQLELTLPYAVEAASNRSVFWDKLITADRSVQPHTAPHENGQLWSGWNYHVAWEVARYVRKGLTNAAAVMSRVNDLATSTNPYVDEYAEVIKDLIAGRIVNRAVNPLLASGLTGWSTWYTEPPVSDATVTTSHIQPGRHTLRMTGASAAASLMQTDIAVDPGFIRASMWFYAPPSSTPQATISLLAWCYDSTGKQLPTRCGDLIRATKCTGSWTEITWTDHLPPGVSTIILSATLSEISGGTEIYCGGVEILQRDASASYVFPDDPTA